MAEPVTFHLQRDHDHSGVSGTGRVAEGVEFTDGSVALHWLGEWPSSVVFPLRGMLAVEAIHGHGGATRVVYTKCAWSPAGMKTGEKPMNSRRGSIGRSGIKPK